MISLLPNETEHQSDVLALQVNILHQLDYGHISGFGSVLEQAAMQLLTGDTTMFLQPQGIIT